MQAPSLQLLCALRAIESVYSIPVCQRHGLNTTRLNVAGVQTQLGRHTSKAHFSLSAISKDVSSPSKSNTDRGPVSKEDTQTDFGSMNVLGNTPPPTTSIDACLTDGFHLDNGLKIGGGSGCLLVAGEAFSWRPWEAVGKAGSSNRGGMINAKGQWAVSKEAWGVLDLVWPKPGV